MSTKKLFQPNRLYFSAESKTSHKQHSNIIALLGLEKNLTDNSPQFPTDTTAHVIMQTEVLVFFRPTTRNTNAERLHFFPSTRQRRFFSRLTRGFAFFAAIFFFGAASRADDSFFFRGLVFFLRDQYGA